MTKNNRNDNQNLLQTIFQKLNDKSKYDTIVNEYYDQKDFSTDIINIKIDSVFYKEYIELQTMNNVRMATILYILAQKYDKFPVNGSFVFKGKLIKKL